VSDKKQHAPDRPASPEKNGHVRKLPRAWRTY
jgi:hypothetical protein